MHYSKRVDRLAGEAVDAWEIHVEALAARRRGEKVFVLSVGDPDFATPDAISEAAIAALHAGDTHYTDIPGRNTLREAIAVHHNRISGQAVGAGQVIVTAGAQNALYCVAQCLCQEGDEVLVPEPMYLTYEASVRASGAELVTVPVHALDFTLDLAALERAITPRTRAIFFATPCNPTGVVMSEKALAGIADIARRHDLWVVSDEVYAQIVFEATHRSIAAFEGMAERTVTISSVSKSHAMAGWRLGWAVGPRELMGHMENLILCVLYGVPGFVQEAGLAALTREADAAKALCARYQARRDLVHARLSRAPGLKCRLPEAGMFMMIDVSGLGMSVKDFTWALFRETGVSVLDAEAFGPTARGHVRLGFVLAEPELEEACARIARFCEARLVKAEA